MATPTRTQTSSVRPAAAEDAPAIARVHIRAWRETYPALVPQAYLDRLPSTYEARLARWRRRAADKERVVLVAEAAGAVVGFAHLGPARDADLAPRGELEAIYLLRAHQGRGLGRALLSEGFRRLRERGFRDAYCWLLEGNPALRFYRRTGAVLNGMRRPVELGGRTLTHLACVWDDLDLFLKSV